MKWGETHCPMCEKPLAQDGDYDKYAAGEGEHLCWNYPLYPCTDKDEVDRFIEVLSQRNELAYCCQILTRFIMTRLPEGADTPSEVVHVESTVARMGTIKLSDDLYILHRE